MPNSSSRISNFRSTPVVFRALKKALAAGIIALALTSPLVSAASSITNTFLTSSTGTSLIAVGNTIQFEVTVELNAAQAYLAALWTLSGDTASAIGSSAGSGWAGVDNIVSDWDWYYSTISGAGGTEVRIGEISFVPFAPSVPAPDRVTGLYGFLESETGDGIPSMVGTVTITADASGLFTGGGYLQPGVGAFGNSTVLDFVTINGGQFTVVPEPSTALLLILGMVGLTATWKR